jgi:hypothetical protein
MCFIINRWYVVHRHISKCGFSKLTCISFMRNLCYALCVINFYVKIFKSVWNRSNPTIFIWPVSASIKRIIYFIVMWVTCRDLQLQDICICMSVLACTSIHVRSGSITFLGVPCPGCNFFLLCVFICCDWNLKRIQEPVFQLQPPNGIENIMGNLTHLVLYGPLWVVECIIQNYLTVNTLRMETTLPKRQHHILECLNPYAFIEINPLFLTTYSAPSVPQSVLLDVKLNTTLYICT